MREPFEVFKNEHTQTIKLIAVREVDLNERQNIFYKTETETKVEVQIKDQVYISLTNLKMSWYMNQNRATMSHYQTPVSVLGELHSGLVDHAVDDLQVTELYNSVLSLNIF